MKTEATGHCCSWHRSEAAAKKTNDQSNETIERLNYSLTNSLALCAVKFDSLKISPTFWDAGQRYYQWKVFESNFKYCQYLILNENLPLAKFCVSARNLLSNKKLSSKVISNLRSKSKSLHRCRGSILFCSQNPSEQLLFWPKTPPKKSQKGVEYFALRQFWDFFWVAKTGKVPVAAAFQIPFVP